MLVFQTKMGIILKYHGHLGRANTGWKPVIRVIKGDADIEVSNETILLVTKFRIGESLRFLSHAETLKVFQRACVRAGIQIQHSQGFNPHPKMSLPLPRPVGVESDDELLCFQCSADSRSDLCDLVMAGLSEQVPEGIELLSVSLAETNTSLQPCSATYIIKVQPEYLNGTIKARIERLLANKSLLVTRALHHTVQGRDSGHDCRGTPSVAKEIDVRPFLKSIKLDNNSIIVQYEISPTGSIRADEILELLELEAGMLAAPIKRTNVQWKKT